MFVYIINRSVCDLIIIIIIIKFPIILKQSQMGSSTSKSKEPKTPKCSPTLKAGQLAKDTKKR